MKLLFDQNLSPRLTEHLRDLFPGSNHVFYLEMDKHSDREVRLFAAKEGFTVVTKDADYGELFSLLGGPPQIIWIRRGNCSTQMVEQLIRSRVEDILRLVADSEKGVLTIY